MHMKLLQGKHMFAWDTLLCLFEENLHAWVSVALESLDFTGTKHVTLSPQQVLISDLNWPKSKG